MIPDISIDVCCDQSKGTSDVLLAGGNDLNSKYLIYKVFEF